MQHARSIELTAPAKINWHLKVLHRRPDRYHEIVSLMQKVDLRDRLIFEPADEIHLETYPEMDIPVTQNLVYRSATILRDYSSYRFGAMIRLVKHIPTGAGLGGGSSDALTTLIALNELWDLRLTRDELSAIALQIGSDVPFFLCRSAAIVGGRGELIQEIDLQPDLPVLLIRPELSISTKDAYEALNRVYELQKDQVEMLELVRAINNRDFKALSKLAVNDFETVLFAKYPELSEIKRRLTSLGALFSLLTGSGSVVYGVFADLETATVASKHFGDYHCYITKTL